MNVRQLLSPVVAACALAGASMSSHAAVLLSEGFDSVAALSGAGWVFKNNSSPTPLPPSATTWFQGNTAVFDAASGAVDSYAAANLTGAGDPPPAGARISNWLFTPEVSLDQPSSFEFALRLLGDGFLDIVGVYLSTSGASTDVGTTSLSEGVFSLLDAYSNDGADTGWVNRTIGVAGFGPGTTGRLAFRYFVDNTDIDGNYVGIDSVRLSTRDATVPEPTPAALLALALVGMAALRRRR